MKKFLEEQTRNISYLEYQLNYQKDLEKAAQSEGQPEKAAEASETSGDTGSIPGHGTKTPQAMGQLRPRTTTTELAHLN